MLSKIALLGVMGHGKSSVANLFAGLDYFKVSNGVDTCTKSTSSYKNGNFEIFDTQGLNDKDDIDVKNLQEMILTCKKERLNALFLVINGQVCRIDEGFKKIIRQICKLFMGKYIWKQIGLIFTHYGYSEEEQDEVREREEDFIKQVLNTAEEEYKEIIKTQDQNNKTCDENEKIVDTLRCFYVNAKRRRNGNYDSHTLEEIEKIKNLVKKYPPINKVQSKFIVKKEVLKDQKGDVSNKLIEIRETGLMAGLKTAGCYTFGALVIVLSPYYLLDAGICKLIGLPFDDDSFFNKSGDISIDLLKDIPRYFTEIPDELNTKIIGN